MKRGISQEVGFAVLQKLFGFLTIFLISASALAEPTVIFKGDKVVSTDTYLVPPKPGKITKVPKEVIRQELASIRQEAKKRIESEPPLFHFPYKTEGLTLGKVESKSVSNPKIPRPFFLVGTDEYSRAWLQKNLQKFKAAGAVGFVVEAKNWEEYKAIQQLAGEVQVIRFDWNGFGAKLALTHYPVYVTATSIEQ